jgi:hypothetical protein
MTAIGVTGYLFYLGEFILALISMVVFGKLIIFHFVMEYFDKQNLKQKYSNFQNNKSVIHS